MSLPRRFTNGLWLLPLWLAAFGLWGAAIGLEPGLGRPALSFALASMDLATNEVERQQRRIAGALGASDERCFSQARSGT